MTIHISHAVRQENWSKLPRVRYTNSGFINDNFLESISSDLSRGWFRVDDEGVNAAWVQLKHLYNKVRDELRPGMHEPGELDPRLIIPVFHDVLGFYRRKKKFTPPNHNTQIEPDHLLFSSQAIANRFFKEKGREARDLKTLVSICESKTWDQPLDIRRNVQELSPHEQVLRDMRLTEAPYAILTNGHKWRLYSRESLSKAAHYFEMSLPQICESNDEEMFELFYNFFSKKALEGESGQSHVQRLINNSLEFGSKLETNLRLRMYASVEFLLSGLHKAAPELDLNEKYRSAIMLMYRVLFTLKAEDAGLLPLID
jgi:hypothetical protein